ncbi:MAG: helix-turn-helix domain-containing protein [Woeseiaceae bacterium]
MSEPFGALLRNWRGQRRMSQLDLGLAADVSARHISFLETGRARPSQAMVLQLSESLDVPRGIRNNLLNAAGFAKVYAARDLEQEEMTFVREAMDWTLSRHDPYPAIAFDRHWRLLRLNQCAAALLDAMNLGIGDSLLDAFIDGGRFADALDNRDEVARHMVTRLRTESSHLGGDDVLDAAAHRIAETLGDVAPIQHESMPAIIPARYRSNGVLLSFFSTISQFGSTEDIALADVKIELMFPADEFTRNALASRLS